ncbi:MAG TPA: HD domain-containing protein [Steroidobacteraceae bacterium]|nr:HD domain-containing protein [Steroidobacteraceae bacterium]
MVNSRRSDFDITNTVRVSSPPAVLHAIEQLFAGTWPGVPTDALRRAVTQFDEMFSGRMPGYAGVDTLYHDRQHTLDVTLTMARICAGYERQVEPLWKLGADRAMAGVIMALFHDVGYLRRSSDTAQRNGAEFTRTHVSRGVEFLRGYLPQLELGHWVGVASQVLHFTGYEKPFSELVLDDARDLRLGHLLGTADMITQMADRCYLEKCRDRLYPEFVLGGMALPLENASAEQVRYASGLDLLRQTPQFAAETRAKRLDGEFNRAYRYLEILFDGRNPYLESIERNLKFLEQVLRSESWRLLRRNPPLYAADPDALAQVRGQMLSLFKRAWLRD